MEIAKRLRLAITAQTRAGKCTDEHAERMESREMAMAPTSTTRIVNANDFLFECKLDQINLFELRRHVDETNLLRRVGGYCDLVEKKKKEQQQEETVRVEGGASGGGQGGREPVRSREAGAQSSHCFALRRFLELVDCLTNAEADGRIVVTIPSAPSLIPAPTTSSKGPDFAHRSHAKDAPPSARHVSTGGIEASGGDGERVDTGEGAIKYVLLNPSSVFKPLVDEAKAVVLLGGTLQPFDLLRQLLMPSVGPDRFRTFTCDHVVPSTNLCTLVLGRGPRGLPLDLTHSHRHTSATMNEVFDTLLMVCGETPHGVVVFCPSYAYMLSAIAHWRDAHLLGRLESIKSVFVEPRTGGTELDDVWTSYCAHATRGGAVLFSVVGGKLSEGINFSDKLARCVVMMGFPYPDTRDPVLQMRMERAEADGLKAQKRQGQGQGRGQGTGGGRAYVDAICMRAVNQSIGRAIRHARDFAAIVLLDMRYTREGVQQQLPSWIGRTLRVCASANEAAQALSAFFRHMDVSATHDPASRVETSNTRC